MEKLKKHNFTLLKGGLDKINIKDYFFRTGYVTDTRLMGVEVLYIHWYNPSLHNNFHQFFYFDAEEYGLESYYSLSDQEVKNISLIESFMTGGLGGKKIEVSEKEAAFLVQEYVLYSEKQKMPLPSNNEEFQFLLTPEIKLKQDETDWLYGKRCTQITSVYEAIHYFLMRIFARDFAPLFYLKGPERFPVDLFKNLGPCCLARNSIDLTGETYTAESLLDFDDKYYLALTEMTMANMKVSSFKRLSLFPISSYEASLLLRRPEYISCYDLTDEEIEEMGSGQILKNRSLMTLYGKGRLFMIYNKNNNHVKGPLYKLHDDVFAYYFVSDYGQLLLCSNSSENLQVLEDDLLMRRGRLPLSFVGRFESESPVLYDFILDDTEDFVDFIEFYQD